MPLQGQPYMAAPEGFHMAKTGNPETGHKTRLYKRYNPRNSD
jgi:hypothetical protein